MDWKTDSSKSIQGSPKKEVSAISGAMREKLKFILTSISKLVGLTIIFIIVSLGFNAGERLLFERKISRIIKDKSETEIIAADLFRMKHSEYFCLVNRWQEDGKPSGSPMGKPFNLNVLQESGFVEKEIQSYRHPVHTGSLYYMLFWDYHDSFAMGLSREGKFRYIRKIGFLPWVDIESEFGCFRPDKRIVLRKTGDPFNIRYTIFIPK